MLKTLVAAWIVAIVAAAAPAAERPANRVLFIGIDGCRTDALLAGKVPHLRSLIAAGAMSQATNILGPRDDKADTVSGPGWSNLLTGVWADKHGVLDNKFRVMHYEEFPHFFRHVKDIFPAAKTASYCTWPPIHDYIIDAADESLVFLDDDKSAHYRQADEKCTAKVVDVLAHGDPDVLFFYLGAVDETGHQKGFHPSVPEYMDALETADAQVGRALAALHARPRYDQEHWLMLVGTDHGGRGKDHGGGRSVPEINTVWLIVSGPDAAIGSIEGPTQQVDLAATALTHLGVPLKPEWKLDGRPVALKRPPAAD
jgi:predicted AlkP superfamily pyrophosphatase or phosphodiesterase